VQSQNHDRVTAHTKGAVDRSSGRTTAKFGAVGQPLRVGWAASLLLHDQLNIRLQANFFVLDQTLPEQLMQACKRYIPSSLEASNLLSAHCVTIYDPAPARAILLAFATFDEAVGVVEVDLKVFGLDRPTNNHVLVLAVDVLLHVLSQLVGAVVLESR